MWSFGVTLWEILTLARRRPHHHLSDDLLFHALVSTHAHILTPPPADDTYATPQVGLMKYKGAVLLMQDSSSPPC